MLPSLIRIFMTLCCVSLHQIIAWEVGNWCQEDSRVQFKSRAISEASAELLSVTQEKTQDEGIKPGRGEVEGRGNVGGDLELNDRCDLITG